MRRNLFSVLLFFLAAAPPGGSPAGAAPPADRLGPPPTHFIRKAVPRDPARWLLKGRPGPDPLLALTASGRLFSVRVKRTAAGAGNVPALRNRPLATGFSARIPPAPLGEGRFASPGRDGTLRIADALTRKVQIVPSRRPLSPLSRPVALSPHALAAVGSDGSVMVFQERDGRWAETNFFSTEASGGGNFGALVDGILNAADLDGDGRKELIVLGAPSRRYRHAVLGDGIEPTDVRVYKLEGEKLHYVTSYLSGAFGVFEAIGTAAADLDGDGRAEILLTQSGNEGGAAHIALSLQEKRLVRKASGKPVGLGHRWSHLLGAFDAGGGRQTILALETPHLAGYLLALQHEGGTLTERARRPGYTTHAIGSRNMWQFAVMRREGRNEVILQEAGRNRLSALTLDGKHWRVRWTFPLSFPVNSNILTADFDGDGGDDLAFADNHGAVHLFLSK